MSRLTDVLFSLDKSKLDNLLKQKGFVYKNVSDDITIINEQLDIELKIFVRNDIVYCLNTKNENDYILSFTFDFDDIFANLSFLLADLCKKVEVKQKPFVEFGNIRIHKGNVENHLLDILKSSGIEIMKILRENGFYVQADLPNCFYVNDNEGNSFVVYTKKLNGKTAIFSNTLYRSDKVEWQLSDDINNLIGVDSGLKAFINVMKTKISKTIDIDKKYYIFNDTQKQIKDICDNLADLLIYKNQKYGNSALEPKNIFYKGNAESSILIRLDDKIGRIINNKDGIRINDVCDIIGYLVLYLVLKDVKNEEIQKLKD